MTDDEATRKARRLWGPKSVTAATVGPDGHPLHIVGIRTPPPDNLLVGGVGASWEEAFGAIERRRPRPS